MVNRGLTWVTLIENHELSLRRPGTDVEEPTMYHLPVFPKVTAAIYYSDHTLSKEKYSDLLKMFSMGSELKLILGGPTVIH